MAISTVSLPLADFRESDKDRAIFFGSIYVGLVDTDPEIEANRKVVSVLQEDGTLVATTQPLTTGPGGFIMVNGSAVQVVVDGNYSLKVLDRSGSQIYYIPDRNAAGDGGGGSGAFIPLAGTDINDPVTGIIEYDSETQTYWTGIFPPPFGFSIADQVQDGAAVFTINMGGIITQYDSQGQWGVNTVYTVDTPGNILVTKQWVTDNFALPGADFVPLTGTTAGSEMSGLIGWSNSVNSKLFYIGVLEGFFDDVLIVGKSQDGLAGGAALSASDGTNVYNATLTENGEFIVPVDGALAGQVVYDNADPSALVPKSWIENAISTGVGSGFVPLAGTNPGEAVTGTIEFDDTNSKATIGQINLPGNGLVGLTLSLDLTSPAGTAINLSTLTDIFAFLDNRLVGPGMQVRAAQDLTKNYDISASLSGSTTTLLVAPSQADSGFKISSQAADTTAYSLDGLPTGTLSWSGDAISVAGSNSNLNSAGVTADLALLGDVIVQAGGSNTGRIDIDGNPTSGLGVGNRAYNDGRYTRSGIAQTITPQWTFEEALISNKGVFATLPAIEGFDVTYVLGGLAYRASDLRLKENVTELEYGLDEVLQLAPIRYDWIDGAKGQVGFGAQWVKDVIPEAVPHDEANDVYGVSNIALTAALVNAVKDLSAKCEELEERVASLGG